MAPPSRSGSRPGRALAALAVADPDHADLDHRQADVQPGQLAQAVQGRPRARPVQRHRGGAEGGDREGAAPSAGAMQQAISVLESRVNGTGNSGAQVQQAGRRPDQRDRPRQGRAGRHRPGQLDRQAGVPAGAARGAVHGAAGDPHAERQRSVGHRPRRRARRPRRRAPPPPRAGIAPRPSAAAQPTPRARARRRRPRRSPPARQPDREQHAHHERSAKASSTPRRAASPTATASATPTATSTRRSSTSPTATRPR